MSAPIPAQPGMTPSEASPGSAGARIVVTGGTEPSVEEIAALVIALGAVDVAPVDEASTVDAWRRAALVEAVGGARVLAPANLHTPVHERWG